MKLVAILVLGIVLCGAALPLAAQPRVSPEHLYERVYAVVPMVGSGTWDDPKRPMFTANPRTKRRLTPAEQALTAEEENDRDSRGIIGFSYVVSDDGDYALVEFVATDVRALEPIERSNRPDVKVFRKGRASKEEVEAEFRRHKSDFSLEQLPGVTP
jgi:hypothetical protein